MPGLSSREVCSNFLPISPRGRWGLQQWRGSSTDGQRETRTPHTVCLPVPVSEERVQHSQEGLKGSLTTSRLNSTGLDRDGPLGQSWALPKVFSVPQTRTSSSSSPGTLSLCNKRPTCSAGWLEGVFQSVALLSGKGWFSYSTLGKSCWCWGEAGGRLPWRQEGAGFPVLSCWDPGAQPPFPASHSSLLLQSPEPTGLSTFPQCLGLTLLTSLGEHGP